MKKYFRYVLDILYPKICVSCEKMLQSSDQHFCLSCLLSLPKTNSHNTETELIDRKFWGKLEVKKTYAFLQFTKKGKVQHILHQLKYKNKPDLAEYLGKMYGNELKSINFAQNIDFIVGIPLHKSKKLQRGYNQADCFGQGLSEVLEVPLALDVLERTVYTESQTKTKDRISRFKNIEGVFKAINVEKIAGKRIALVDDVLTSGATLEAAGQVLKANGCKDLYIVTLASAI